MCTHTGGVSKTKLEVPFLYQWYCSICIISFFFVSSLFLIFHPLITGKHKPDSELHHLHTNPPPFFLFVVQSLVMVRGAFLFLQWRTNKIELYSPLMSSNSTQKLKRNSNSIGIKSETTIGGGGDECWE